MSDESAPARSTRILLGIIAFILVVAALREASSLAVPMLLALFAALIAEPFVSWLRQKGAPTWLAVVGVVLAVTLLVTAFGWLAGGSVQDFSAKVPGYQHQLNDRLDSLKALFGERGDEVTGVLINAFDPSKAMSLAANLLNGIRGALTNAFLIVFTMILILFDMTALPEKLEAAIPNSKSVLRYVYTVEDSLKRYIGIKTLISLITGVLIGTFLAILGVDFPVLWGLLAFLLNFIPNIGSILAAIPPVLLASIQFGPGKALIAAGGFVVVNVVIGNLIEPRITGQGLGLSTLVVFLSLVFWGWVLGTVGMLLAVPLTMSLKIALESRPDTRWVAVLMGGPPKKEPDTASDLA